MAATGIDGSLHAGRRAGWLVAMCIGCPLLGSGTVRAQLAVEGNQGDAIPTEQVNNGEDFTRPLSRLDLRYQYQESGTPRRDTNIFTLRGDRPIQLDKSWKLALRVDVPMRYTDVVSHDNPAGDYQFGAGDLLTQVAIIKTLTERWAAGAGSQFIFPTASTSAMGSGKYQAAPTVGVRYMLQEISAGSFAQGQILYFFDAAGDSSLKHISILQFDPKIDIRLPNSWFVELYPSADIRINLGPRRAGSTGDLFLPFDAMVGKMFGKTMIATVEVGVPIIDEYRVYNFKLQARVGFFF